MLLGTSLELIYLTYIYVYGYFPHSLLSTRKLRLASGGKPPFLELKSNPGNVHKDWV